MKKLLFAAVAACATLISGSVLAAQFLTVLTVQTDDVPGYAKFVGELNKVWEAENVPASGTVYVPMQAGEQVGVAYFVGWADSGEQWLAMGSSSTQNKAVMDVIAGAETVRTRVNNSLWTALIDGDVYEPGVVYVTNVTTTDTAAYLAAIGRLDELMSANELDDARVSVYSAVAAGDSAGQLQVIISLPNQERMAALMDAMNSDWLREFLASVAPIRTLVSNGIFGTVPTE